ncbi:hypothetical protein E2C01_009405 [Portunus trituberculatus]|uniref:Uncharacterized protein n=1 Tax=Portunus trituberculatus TaxID=210409 RepID=A0A5B7D517_PORTR|nr:hypothetical protein [Portunus trituberculatus]
MRSVTNSWVLWEERGLGVGSKRRETHSFSLGIFHKSSPDGTGTEDTASYDITGKHDQLRPLHFSWQALSTQQRVKTDC